MRILVRLLLAIFGFELAMNQSPCFSKSAVIYDPSSAARHAVEAILEYLPGKIYPLNQRGKFNPSPPDFMKSKLLSPAGTR